MINERKRKEAKDQKPREQFEFHLPILLLAIPKSAYSLIPDRPRVKLPNATFGHFGPADIRITSNKGTVHIGKPRLKPLPTTVFDAGNLWSTITPTSEFLLEEEEH